MLLLLSGEGPTDLGFCSNSQTKCDGQDFMPGPLTLLIDQLFGERLGYSVLEIGAFRFVGKTALVERAAELKAKPKSAKLPGKKRAKETTFYYTNARALARIAIDLESSDRGQVVAVLFRDNDGTASFDRGEFDRKYQSMMNGFEEEHFERGVPMLALPKSEAWILCAVKQKYQNCEALESRPGNDASPNSLKNELKEHLGDVPDRDRLNKLVQDGSIVAAKIAMPSFEKFRIRLVSLLSNIVAEGFEIHEDELNQLQDKDE